MRKLIALYFHLDARYKETWKYSCERLSNNKEPVFSDVEVLTVYLYGITEERRLRISDIYGFTKRHLLSWFPRLPSYQAFVYRLNRLSEALRGMLAEVLVDFLPDDIIEDQSLVDSMPIVTCAGSRKGLVAREITSKGYCSTKNMYYHGLKIHALGHRRKGKMPWPERLVVTAAEENDLNVFKQEWNGLNGRTFFGDKIYMNKQWFDELFESTGSEMLTPVKGVKGMLMETKQFNKAADDLFSRAVSKFRQPVESFFNWLIEKTDIQRASKVRSTSGLLVHVFGKITAAFLAIVFNP